MKPGPVGAAVIIAKTISVSQPPVEIVQLVTEVILERGWANGRSKARELAERWHDRARYRLREELNVLAEVGRPTRFVFNTSSDYHVQGACFEQPDDTEDIKTAKRKRRQAEQYEEVLRDLSPIQLESLCGKLMSLFGVEDPVVTRGSADEGIDFYGRLKLESFLYPRDIKPTIQKQLTVWLVGQAKHYLKVQSGTEELRSLAGSVVLGRQGAFGSKENPLSGLQIRPFDPVFAMFVTSGTLSANAWRLLSRSGVIGVDGSTLAAFLADRAVGHVDGKLDVDAFKSWLESKAA